MKKILFSLFALLLIPVVANAASIETSFDSERCVLTVSGVQTGHEATASLFDTNHNLIGFKTDSIENGNYSIEFVLGYDEDKVIDITLADENGSNKVSKNAVNIPACDAPEVEHHDEHHDEEHGDEDIFYMNKIEDIDKNSVEDLNSHKPFHIDDGLIIETISSEDFDELPEEDQENVAALREYLGEYKEIVALMFVNLIDGEHEPKGIPDSSYRLLLKAPKEAYTAFSKLKAIRVVNTEELEFTRPVNISYDDNAQGMYFTSDNIGVFVIYNDNSTEYEFLDNTDNQTFYKKSDKTLTIRINALFDKFIDVYVDGKKVDKKYYTAKSGSTIITFTEEFLKSLDSGEHEIVVDFTDGSATTTLTVDNSSNPNTGDKMPIYVGSALIALSCLGAALLLNKKLKRN